jgi:predicted nucleic-acid-binding protein
MLAIDTNLLVRFLTRDEPDQHKRAEALIETKQVFIATTVLLETAWVLKTTFRYRSQDIAAALDRVAGLATVTLENAERAARAFAWTSAGMDFAEALHLAAAEGCEGFVTFDRKLISAAAAISPTPVREP